MKHLFSFTSSEFVDYIYSKLGKGRVHAAIFYQHFIRRGEIPTDHPAFRNAKALLDQIIELTDLTILPVNMSRTDGQTSKFMLGVGDGLEVESVVIPMVAGGTLCVSSQVGCKMGCAFCETGRMGLLKNLSSEEIVSQLYVARVQLGQAIRNIVFMGMGEPFDNYDNVLQAARVMMDPYGFGYGKKNLTISTSGKVPEIRKYTQEKGNLPNLAISLTAPLDALRNKLMPVNRKYNLEVLHAAMADYNKLTGREILVAYVLMKDVNDSPEHADLLVDYLKNLSVKVNLIPYNPQTHDRYQRSAPEQIQAFYQKVRGSGLTTLLRNTKGDEIMAACGQLGKQRLRAIS